MSSCMRAHVSPDRCCKTNPSPCRPQSPKASYLQPRDAASNAPRSSKSACVPMARSAPYHPATNGEAERFVQTFKRSLQAGRKDSGTVPQKLATFLMSYRTTPNTTTGVTPAELFLGRKLRTRLDLLKPSVKEHVHEQVQKQKKYHDQHARQRTYRVGQSVLVRNLRDGPRWLVGRVIEELGPANYEVQVNGQIWMRHADQLIAYKGVPEPDSDAVSPGVDREDQTVDLSVPPSEIPVAVSVETEHTEPAAREETDLDLTLPVEPSTPTPPVPGTPKVYPPP